MLFPCWEPEMQTSACCVFVSNAYRILWNLPFAKNHGIPHVGNEEVYIIRAQIYTGLWGRTQKKQLVGIFPGGMVLRIRVGE